MDPTLAKAAMEFLQRVQINAKEIATFLQVASALSRMANSPIKPSLDAPEPQDVEQPSK